MNIVTLDESLVHHYDLEDKRQSIVSLQVFNSSISAENILTNFYWWQSVICTEFMPKGMMINFASIIKTCKH